MKSFICAIDAEYNHIKSYFKVTDEYSISESCKIAECMKDNLIIMKTGIGKKSAKKYTKILLKKYSPDAVYSTGIAGAISDKIAPGDIVVGDVGKNYVKGKVIEEYSFIQPKISGIQAIGVIKIWYGGILCVDNFIHDIEMKRKMENAYRVLCVEMESSGVAQACIKYDIPCGAIKCISDKADDRAVLSILKRQDEIANRLGKILKELLDKGLV